MAIPSSLAPHLSLPLVCAPMFLVSGSELVKASCLQGVVGTFPALNLRTSEAFEQQLIEISETLEAAQSADPQRSIAPYGVNLIVHGTNPRLQEDLGLCIKHRVPLVITSLGAAAEVVNAVHGYGGLVFHDVTNLRHAQKAAAAGVDGIIAVAGGAGGHAGTQNPFSLIAEIRRFFSGTLLLAGALSRGEDLLAAQAMGADMAYMGTRFINTRESLASSDYKAMVIEAGAADIIHTPAVSGVPASFMRQSLERAGYDLARLSKPGDINYGEKLKPADDEAKAWKTVWSAGHGVAVIDDLPSVEALCHRLKQEYHDAHQRLLADSAPFIL
ncbi:NAD(P)H-dependent flavin oxidoreductase [Aestuariirhabdus litorea]|uniref:Nitronate monooxygenase n=1 Tax=Aestuariirhabdus litorea TaxID=2528527 RepID=A0A3P3VUK5_9GAMM|nr:nitronate monooxygenase family protein [Aestuariirhabdus litorea]RRJ85306.1 nitronate monooxygenase [Aestuariirhabdus litorea]RWW98528.1 nitronate monooxygenase [Endozoicomonadaceae bacterium GTF-13]